MIIQLPNGLLDGTDLYNYAEIDELRGKQQNYLVNREYIVNNIGHIPKILEDMVLCFQTKEGRKWKGKIDQGVWQVPSGDIETLLIRIREKTYGPRFYHEAVCSNCGHENKDLKLDLSTLELDVMPFEEMIQPKIVTLPKEEKDVELRPQYMADLFEGIAISNDKHDEIITASLAVTIKRIGDKEDITSDDIGNLRNTDLIYLNEQAEGIKLEGTIDTDIIIECEKCKKEFTARLNPLNPDFFSPTGGSTSLTI